ncbi:MAG TPA: flagellar basal body P-ring protein FlgI, partial [Gemmataceae bacterium]|nr:flagellar basal body P-ring protein FlgI [Gemmataceae bacterium]
CRGCRSFPARAAVLASLTAAFLGLVGCVSPQTRGQAEEEPERDRYEVKTIGHVAQVANADPIPVAGIGLVVGLNGTGSSPPPGGYRATLEQDLLKLKIENVKQLLDSSDISMVQVSALIPPGAHKDDRIDVDVMLPPGSRSTSLRGGRLVPCSLFNFEFARNLSERAANSDAMLQGHPLAVAQGMLLVGFGDGDEAAVSKQGRIWGGARLKTDRPFYLALNDDQQYARVAATVADRTNDTFHGRYLGGPSAAVATAKTSSGVYLNVPQQYKHNLPRYLRVVCKIPMRQDAAQSGYRRRLSEDLLDPARAVAAALRLEALGKDSVPVLKRGLQSDRPLVRFVAAEALAYLDDPLAAQELAQAVESYPDLRAFGLSALASLDEAASRVQLRRLLASATPEVRYGAFRALRALDEHDQAVQGELLADSFWLHRVLPNSEPLVHFSTTRRAEIVLFGLDPALKPPLAISAGEFTLTASAENQQCTIGHFSPQNGISHRQCSFKIEDVIRAMADDGATYPEILEVLRQAHARGNEDCPIANDALPQATSVQDLASLGRRLKDGTDGDSNIDPAIVQRDTEVRNARGDLGATPTLFDSGRRASPAIDTDEQVLQRDRKGKSEKKTASRND